MPCKVTVIKMFSSGEYVMHLMFSLLRRSPSMINENATVAGLKKAVRVTQPGPSKASLGPGVFCKTRPQGAGFGGGDLEGAVSTL